MNKTKKPVRWSLQHAATEFGYARQTIKTRLMASAIEAGADGCYSTREIVTACFGDLEFERIRKTRGEANLIEIKEAQANRELVELKVVQIVIRNFMLAARAAIMAQDIDPRSKQKIVQAIKDIPDEAFISDEEEGGEAPAE